MTILQLWLLEEAHGWPSEQAPGQNHRSTASQLGGLPKWKKSTLQWDSNIQIWGASDLKSTPLTVRPWSSKMLVADVNSIVWINSWLVPGGRQFYHEALNKLEHEIAQLNIYKQWPRFRTNARYRYMVYQLGGNTTHPLNTINCHLLTACFQYTLLSKEHSRHRFCYCNITNLHSALLLSDHNNSINVYVHCFAFYLSWDILAWRNMILRRKPSRHI